MVSHDETNNAACNNDGGDCCGYSTQQYTTTTPSPYGCGFPQFANDLWCDDENNNPGCNFDGGACCNNITTWDGWDGWDDYCTVIYNHAFLINNPCLTYFVIFAEM